jgi:C4-dicarboxylate-specific signal transduction histidine kinase
MNTGNQNQLSSISNLSSLDLPEFLACLPIGVIVFRSDLTVVYANRRAYEWMSPAGSIEDTILQGSPASDSSLCREVAESVVAGGQPQSTPPLRFTTKAASRLLRLTWTAVREPAADRIVGGAVFAEDMTAQADLQQQVAQSQRMATVGKVAGKVAHELNNPLDGILRYINLAIRVIDQGQVERAKDYLLQGRTGLMRMVQIVSEMLEFSRGSATAMELSPLDRILQEAISAMEPRAGKVRIELQRPDPRSLPRYRADNLFQVFCNLIKNAIDAMEGDGRLTIAIRRGERQLDIVFRDTGSGFPAEQAEALFQPFFTTKGFGRGTGLGLAICRDIVEKLHGRITAANHPEGGSTFTVTLPTGEENGI